jgi:DNA-binding CsgD family transcriptional regulator
VSSDNRELVREIHRRLLELAMPDSSGAAPQLAVEGLADLLRCKRFAAYRPTRDTDGAWRLGARADTDEEFFVRYSTSMAQATAPFWYDPLRPAIEDRNRVRLMREVHSHGPDETCIVEDVWPVLGVGSHDQMRVLVCEGDVLLGWIGGIREEPFTAAERELFDSFVPDLQRSLKLRRMLLDARVAEAGLGGALEALGAPAFIANASGEVLHANASGRAIFDQSPTDTRARVRDSIARPSDADLVTRLPVSQTEDCFLVILRVFDGATEERMRAAGVRWKLTPRESEVLRGIVEGDANKEIALRLGIHEGSIERYVTGMLRKACCDSRTRLIARFWTAR